MKLLLAKKFNFNFDVSGWYMSEKYDGIRAYWSSKDRNFYTRNGNVIHAPQWFKNTFPDIDLDGEMWISRGKFNELSGIIHTKVPTNAWKNVKFMVFDLPNVKEIYEHRVKLYFNLLKKINCKWIVPVKMYKIKNNDYLLRKLKIIELGGGEGIMIRKPGSMYERKRSSVLYKLKTFTDEEGIVVGYSLGTGKYSNIVGSLEILTGDGIKIHVGTGLTDSERKYPPVVGTTVIYKYFKKSKEGIPRFPVYVGERHDI